MKQLVRRMHLCIYSCLITGLLGIHSVHAIQPGEWHHRTEADFKDGEKTNVVLTNLGELKLAADVENSIDLSEFGDIVFDMARIKSTKSDSPFEAVIAMGPKGILVKCNLADGKATKLLELKGEQIFSLAPTATGQILVAVSSEKNSRIAVLHGNELLTICELKDVRYIWDMALSRDKLFIATGTNGQLFEVDMNWHKDEKIQPRKILDLKQSNITNLAFNHKTSQLFLGTDQEALIYRLDRDGDKWRPYIAYDADGQEVSSLHLAEDGSLYFATAANGESTTGRLTPVMPIEPGKPDTEANKTQEAKKGSAEKKAADKGEDKKNAGKVAEAAKKSAPKKEAPAAPKKPVTSGQRDQLREVIRERLAHHRSQEGSKQQTKKNGSTRSTASAGKSKKGNAIYRLDPEGYVTEVFRESVLVMDMLSQGNKLWAATGDEAELYQVDFDSDEVVMLSDLDPKQISAMVKYQNNVFLASSNPPALYTIPSAFKHAGKGTYTSKALDADQVSLWGTLKVWVNTPAGTAIEISTRSGNVEDPEKGAWSKWSKPSKLAYGEKWQEMSPRHVSISSPPARFLQYRIEFKAGKKATETPVFSSLRLRYVSPNLPPQLAAIVAQNTGGAKKQGDQPKPGPQSVLPPPPAVKNNIMIQWKATDPNNDRLNYELAYKRHGEDRWYPIVKDLVDSRYLWQTTKVPDGLYYVRVTASDQSDNPPSTKLTDKRISSPITVDKLPPSFSDVKSEKQGETLKVSFKLTDQWTDIKEARYSLPGEKYWHLILPEDLIFDSTSETLKVNIPGLSSEQGVITLRASDALGNTSYRILPLK